MQVELKKNRWDPYSIIKNDYSLVVEILDEKLYCD